MTRKWSDWVDCPECGGLGYCAHEEDECPNCCGTGGDYVDVEEVDEEDQMSDTKLVQVEQQRKDAARYRYLRDVSRREALVLEGPEAGVWCDCEDDNGTLILLTESHLDAAIDAAMEGEKSSSALPWASHSEPSSQEQS